MESQGRVGRKELMHRLAGGMSISVFDKRLFFGTIEKKMRSSVREEEREEFCWLE